MTGEELEALIAEIARQLQGQGGDASAADALRRRPVVFEVVGKWPPSSPLQFTPVQVADAIDAVRRARHALAETLPGDPVAASTLQTIDERLNESLVRGFLAGGDEAEEVVGPWPPK